MSTENSETVLASSSNKDKVLKLRSALVNNYRRNCYYVYNRGNGVYEVTAANLWGGRLDANTQADLEIFAKSFMRDES